jgi:hypothetical protein
LAQGLTELAQSSGQYGLVSAARERAQEVVIVTSSQAARAATGRDTGDMCGGTGSYSTRNE